MPTGLHAPEQQSAELAQDWLVPAQHVPDAIPQRPVQHCALPEHAYPVAVQHVIVFVLQPDGTQQSYCAVHGAPPVGGAQGSHLNVLVLQRRPGQHCSLGPLPPQLFPCSVQHAPSTQPPPQHSVGPLQLAAKSLQAGPPQ